MNTVLEILNAYAAIATITSFFLALWANHKNADEAGREPGDGKGRDYPGLPLVPAPPNLDGEAR